MNQFLASIIITICVLCSFFFGVRYMALRGIEVEPTIEFVNRLRAVFTEDEKKEDKSFPFIIEVLVQEESNNNLILNVMYSVPENDDLVYVLSVRPERSDFNIEEKTLDPGLAAERITISFSPKSMFKRRITTQYLTFYIDVFGKSDIDKTYIRKASFLKSWRRKKRKSLFIRNSDYRTF